MEHGTVQPSDTFKAADRGGDAETRTDNTPCAGCGLCCDGTIYVQAKAQPNELESLTAAGLTVFRDGEKHYFRHPCRFSAGGLCTVYNEGRFEICSSFRCKLLKAYHDGEISKEAAVGKVRQALAMRSAIVAEEPAAGLSTERRRLRLELASSNERPHMRLAIVAFDHFLDRWFGKLPRDERAKAKAAKEKQASAPLGEQLGGKGH